MMRLPQVCAEARQENRKLLVPYLMCGDPNPQATVALMESLVNRGADIIELGFPFSDPTSDGPVIQQSAQRALARGMSLVATLEVVRQFRQANRHTPVVLMGYLNPIEVLGYAEFARRAHAAGVDGTLVVDLPPAAAAPLRAAVAAVADQHGEERGMELIFLVAPTTTAERMAAIVGQCGGYVYYVSLKGVTGAALTDQEAVGQRLQLLRRATSLPIVVGFGIRDAAGAAALARHADGIVIGSALVESVRAATRDLGSQELPTAAQVAAATAVIGEIRDAMDRLGNLGTSQDLRCSARRG